MAKVENLMGLGMESSLANEVSTDTVTSSPARSVSTGLTATGTVIGDALQLVSLVNVVSTAAASTGVKLPPYVAIGETVTVQNNGASILNLFPPTSTGTLNGGSAGTAVTIAAAAGNTATRLSATDWLVNVTAKES